MDSPVPASASPAATIDEVIARRRSIDAALPAGDGVACFNRMYLEVTTGVSQRIDQGFFGDPAFVSHLDVVFANIYFDAVDALSGPSAAIPAAWPPLLAARSTPGIEPIQFALAGMNAHINHAETLRALRDAVTERVATERRIAEAITDASGAVPVGRQVSGPVPGARSAARPSRNLPV